MPILNHDGDLMGVAQIINKNDGSAEFTIEDIEVCIKYYVMHVYDSEHVMMSG